MTSNAFFQGFTSMAMLIVALGAQNVFILRQGLRREHVAAVVVLCTLSDVALIQAGVWGMGGWLGEGGAWATVLRWLGALFLLAYAGMAAQRALRPAAVDLGASMPAAPLRTTLWTLAAFTWLNPHVYLDTVVLLGTVAATVAPQQRMAFAAGASLASAGWFVLLGFGARYFARWLVSAQRWRVLEGFIAMGMVCMAVMLMVM